MSNIIIQTLSVVFSFRNKTQRLSCLTKCTVFTPCDQRKFTSDKILFSIFTALTQVNCTGQTANDDLPFEGYYVCCSI